MYESDVYRIASEGLKPQDSRESDVSCQHLEKLQQK